MVAGRTVGQLRVMVAGLIAGQRLHTTVALPDAPCRRLVADRTVVRRLLTVEVPMDAALHRTEAEAVVAAEPHPTEVEGMVAVAAEPLAAGDTQAAEATLQLRATTPAVAAARTTADTTVTTKL